MRAIASLLERFKFGVRVSVPAMKDHSKPRVFERLLLSSVFFHSAISVSSKGFRQRMFASRAVTLDKKSVPQAQNVTEGGCAIFLQKNDKRLEDKYLAVICERLDEHKLL